MNSNAIQINEYVSRNKVYKLDNVFYDYVHVVIYQYDPDKQSYKVIKPKKNHFIIWQKRPIFLSVMKLDDIILKMFNDAHIMELRKHNPTALILRDYY